MDLELLDRLEDKVDVCVSRIRDLLAENDALRDATRDLETKVAALTRDAQVKTASRGEAEGLRARCAELEKKLERVRHRIEAIVTKIKSLEE